MIDVLAVFLKDLFESANPSACLNKLIYKLIDFEGSRISLLLLSKSLRISSIVEGNKHILLYAQYFTAAFRHLIAPSAQISKYSLPYTKT